MLFEIHAERNVNDKKVFYYDNMTNTLKNSDGVIYESPKPQGWVNNKKEFITVEGCSFLTMFGHDFGY